MRSRELNRNFEETGTEIEMEVVGKKHSNELHVCLCSVSNA